MEEPLEVAGEKKEKGLSRGAVVGISVFVALSIALPVVAFLIARTDVLPDMVRIVSGGSTPTASSSVKTTSIKSSSDLDTITVELDGTDLAALDSELNQLDTDSAMF